jgi:hypothetical protein
MKERSFRGMVDFNLRRLNDLGFSRFKLLRPVRFGPMAK